MDDYYAILGLDRGASPEEIDRAIREQLRVWQRRTAHADLDRRQEAEQRVRLLGEARTILRDPARRRDYHERLAAEPPAGPVAAPSPAVVSFPAQVSRARLGWYAAYGLGGVLLLGVVALLCDPQLALPAMAAAAIVAVLVTVPAAGRRARDRATDLRVDGDGIVLALPDRRTAYPWHAIDSVSVRQAHEAAPAMLVIVENDREHKIDLSRYGYPAGPVRQALARFGGDRLRE